MDYTDYEQAVIESLEDLGEMTTSDAQAVLEASEQTVLYAYDNGISPKRAAETILKP